MCTASRRATSENFLLDMIHDGDSNDDGADKADRRPWLIVLASLRMTGDAEFMSDAASDRADSFPEVVKKLPHVAYEGSQVPWRRGEDVPR